VIKNERKGFKLKELCKTAEAKKTICLDSESDKSERRISPVVFESPRASKTKIVPIEQKRRSSVSKAPIVVQLDCDECESSSNQEVIIIGESSDSWSEKKHKE